VTNLDPPAAAARRQYVLDRIVEDLVGWGCPLDHAEPRARHLLDRVLDGGYRLPASLEGPPPVAAHSTREGRLRARTAYAHRRALPDWTDGVSHAARCHCGHRGPARPAGHTVLRGTDHAHHVQQEQQRAAAEMDAGAPNRGGAVPEDPRRAHSATEGVAR
jgi:hypothetical protein